jgi:hypothetical protein
MKYIKTLPNLSMRDGEESGGEGGRERERERERRNGVGWGGRHTQRTQEKNILDIFWLYRDLNSGPQVLYYLNHAQALYTLDIFLRGLVFLPRLTLDCESPTYASKVTVGQSCPTTLNFFVEMGGSHFFVGAYLKPTEIVLISTSRLAGITCVSHHTQLHWMS